MPHDPIPERVIARDHELDARTLKASEALAEYRWRQIIDPAGPKFKTNEYARAVGRSPATISRFARGYALYLERTVGSGANTPTTLTILDAIELARHGAEAQEFAQAIAEGAEEPVQRIAHPGQRHRRAGIIERARGREERRGGDAVDHARDIAAEEKREAQAARERRQREAARHTRRWMELEALLTRAKKALLDAISASTDVEFSDEEIELLRDSIENVKAVLNLLDVRLLGTPDVDWDADFARLLGARHDTPQATTGRTAR